MRFDVSNRTSSELQKETISAFEFCILKKINSDAMFSSYSFSCASIFVCFSENHLKYFTLSNYQKFPLCWAFCLTCKRVELLAIFTSMLELSDPRLEASTVTVTVISMWRRKSVLASVIALHHWWLRARWLSQEQRDARCFCDSTRSDQQVQPTRL